MKKVYYAILNILRGRGGNLIKIISLALGLTVSIILFTRIAFDLNYDRFYSESEKLYQIKVGYVFDDKPDKPKATIGGKFAGAIAESFPNEDVLFLSLEQQLLLQYKSVHQFSNITLTASVAMFFLILMGLIGYTNDEIHRRSKEIAIRKVNGAETNHILLMFSKDIIYIALPSVLLGTFASWYVSRIWIEMFAEQISLDAFLFVGIALLVLLIIVGCVIIKSWRIANENPVVSIKND